MVKAIWEVCGNRCFGRAINAGLVSSSDEGAGRFPLFAEEI
jgi:hypothetical protein